MNNLGLLVQALMMRHAKTHGRDERRRRFPLPSDSDRDAPTSPDPGPLDQLIDRGVRIGLRRAVQRELEKLPDAQGSALRQRYFENKSVPEIALSAHVPDQTVWSRLRRGEKALSRSTVLSRWWTNTFASRSL